MRPLRWFKWPLTCTAAVLGAAYLVSYLLPTVWLGSTRAIGLASGRVWAVGQYAGPIPTTGLFRCERVAAGAWLVSTSPTTRVLFHPLMCRDSRLELPLAAAGIAAAAFWCRRGRRPNECPACGYDLSGVPRRSEARCPECGAAAG